MQELAYRLDMLFKYTISFVDRLKLKIGKSILLKNYLLRMDEKAIKIRGSYAK